MAEYPKTAQHLWSANALFPDGEPAQRARARQKQLKQLNPRDQERLLEFEEAIWKHEIESLSLLRDYYVKTEIA